MRESRWTQRFCTCTIIIASSYIPLAHTQTYTSVRYVNSPRSIPLPLSPSFFSACSLELAAWHVSNSERSFGRRGRTREEKKEGETKRSRVV